jgi:hypothetical protein
MQIEDADESGGIMTKKQMSLLSKVARNLLIFFGLHFLSDVLNKHITL